jgi:hypothetical protein
VYTVKSEAPLGKVEMKVATKSVAWVLKASTSCGVVA